MGSRKLRWFFLIVGTCFFSLVACADIWRTGYYPGWEQSSMPASQIDFDTLTHVIHFSVVPNSNGTLNSSDNGITTAHSADVTAKAHAAGRSVLICVGGSGSESGFQGATGDANLSVFINNITNFMATRGYDGVDIDWEPFPDSDAAQYTNLIIGLRSALNAFPQHKLLTSAVSAYPMYGESATAKYAMFAAIQNQFDQINIMTYDMSGPWDGWVTWFNSPIYDGGYHFPSNGALIPSINGSVDNYIANGVAAGKLGIGIAFYGYVWTGGTGTPVASITQPRQSWVNAPTATAYSYADIMADYYQSNLYHWDTSAQSAYLSITNVNATKSDFISYDDPRTCQAKVSYARNHDLGGVMIWELAQDHQSGQSSPLVQAISQALATPGMTSIQNSNNDVNLFFNSIALGSYRVQWMNNLSDGIWNTLLITNIPEADAGGVLQVTDPGVMATQFQRFYRIQTPP